MWVGHGAIAVPLPQMAGAGSLTRIANAAATLSILTKYSDVSSDRFSDFDLSHWTAQNKPFKMGSNIALYSLF